MCRDNMCLSFQCCVSGVVPTFSASWSFCCSPGMLGFAFIATFVLLLALMVKRHDHPTNLYLLLAFTLVEAYTVGVVGMHCDDPHTTIHFIPRTFVSSDLLRQTGCYGGICFDNSCICWPYSLYPAEQPWLQHLGCLVRLRETSMVQCGHS